MIHLITPILYSTSSFKDIFYGLKSSFLNKWILFKTNSIRYWKIKWYGLENPEEYFRHNIKTKNYLINNVKNWDILLFSDFFFPWLDLIKYYFTRKNINVKMISLMHWSSFVEWDLYSWNWLKNFEKWWIDIFDYVIVPSNFFLKNIQNNKEFDLSKFKVFAWWLDDKIVSNFKNKKYDIIFPHRFDYDKWVFDFYEIVKKLPNINFLYPSVNENKILTTFPQDLVDLYKKLKQCKNVIFTWLEEWQKHISTLKKSKIILSTAKQEWFWYSVMKAIQCWNIPILPNRCCYTEFFKEKYLYNSIDECCDKIQQFFKNYPKDYPQISSFSFDKIVDFISKFKND
jgi:hypothetical protein